VQEKLEQELAQLREQAHLIKLQIANFNIQHQGTYQALVIERNMLSERLQVN
jgi:hypothetical protein